MSFANPMYLALVLALVPILWLGWRRRNTVGHTQVQIHNNVRAIPLIGWIPTLLVVLLWTAFSIGIAGPRLTTYADKESIDTREIVVMVDTSGSMTSALQNRDQQDFVQQSGGTPAPGTPQVQADQRPATRANAARAGVKMFVDGRQGDRIALLLFDDQVYTACTFTNDLRILNKKLPLIDQYQGGGTNFDGPNPDNPNSRVGAIQGAINHFQEAGRGTKAPVLIMVTDGEDSINPKRFVELSEQIKRMGIHMYVLGVGEGWTNGSQVDLRRFAEEVGGKVFIVGDQQAMREGFAEINKIEKSQIVIERTQGFRPLYMYFLGAAATFALLFLGACLLVREED